VAHGLVKAQAQNLHKEVDGVAGLPERDLRQTLAGCHPREKQSD